MPEEPSDLRDDVAESVRLMQAEDDYDAAKRFVAELRRRLKAGEGDMIGYANLVTKVLREWKARAEGQG